MSDDKDNIVSIFFFSFKKCFACKTLTKQVKLGRKLASTIQSITKDFQIGFGSFVDKEVMPYISLVAKHNCQQVGLIH